MGTTHSRLAYDFAKGKTSGRASRMFIDGDCIYSYGYHWKIAQRIGPAEFLINPTPRSVSTTRHTHIVDQACSTVSRSKVYMAPDCNIEQIPRYYRIAIAKITNKLLRARHPRYIQYYADRITELFEKWYKAAKRFDLSCPEIEKLRNPEAVSRKLLETVLKGDDYGKKRV